METNVIWDQWHSPHFTEGFRFRTKNYVVFWLKQAYSQQATDCGWIEGKLSTDIVVLVRYSLMTPQS